MTAKETISNLYSHGLQEHVEECFIYLSIHAYEFRLADGQRLNDLTDFAAFLRELADACDCDAPHVNYLRERFSHARIERTCPRCGHVHEGEVECGKPMGGAGVCRCEMEVPV